MCLECEVSPSEHHSIAERYGIAPERFEAASYRLACFDPERDEPGLVLGKLLGLLGDPVVTCEMRKAGEQALLAYGSLDEVAASLPLQDVAVEVYEAMRAVSQSPA